MGGVQFSSFYFIKELQKYPKVKIKLLLPRNGQFSKLCEKNFIPFSIYNSRKMYSSSIAFFHDTIRIPNPFAWIYNSIHIYHNSKKVRKILKHNQNAVILSKGLYSHFITIIATRKLSNKLIWHFQDLISNQFGGILLNLMNYLAKIGPNYIICDGNSIFKSLSIYNQSKATIILNGVNEDLFQRTDKHRKFGRKEFNIPKDAYVIGHIGRFTPWKGQLRLVEAFIEYSKQNTKAILFLVGEPVFDSNSYFLDIKTEIIKQGLVGKIILAGFRSDLDKMFSIMDLFIYPSLEKDTSPLSLLSALSSGLPTAVSSIESLREINEKIPAISLFDPSNQSDITNIFQKFEVKHLRAKTGKSINLEFANQFSIKLNTLKIMEVINSI